ncbi:hypothetical protein AGDE_14489 [Angomonas deanei]|uniref:Type III restriction enzyme, res subunit/AAA domain containing protein, putative n=1 Tax=Angomonas deanei TaxID=59799 RepID=A0A7G2CKQ6_9TRYP|nr:hypothetical protein AGDE_14489 [Angomonas deanei]CAD2220448.1 Type III restriction enzyme, res subunit/AAA domain containing protein, putative [Angomonas deanei]|eukprot:EPY20765.1 hypothetical protein AGDE_14489 [Angomonas deanei]
MEPPPQPTRLQQKMKELQARSLHQSMRKDNMQDVRRTMADIALRTHILLPHTSTEDIIGNESTCMATEIPVLPEIFVSHHASVFTAAAVVRSLVPQDTSLLHRYQVASQIYANSFSPHIALELRHDVHSSAQDWFDVCRRNGFERIPARDHRGGNHSGYYTGRFPLNRALLRESVKMRTSQHSAEAVTVSPMEADRVTVRLIPIADENNGSNNHFNKNKNRRGNGQDLTDRKKRRDFGLTENDVVLLLLPLSTFLPSFIEHQMKKTGRPLGELQQEIPPLWEVLGCYPQIAVVQHVEENEITLNTTLLRRPPSAYVTTRTTMSNTLRAQSPFAFPAITHLLHPFSTSRAPMYIKRLSSLNATYTTLSALQDIYNTQFAPTIYDPTATAAESESFYSAVNYYLTTEMLQHVRNRILLGTTLNDWQVKAVASVLYAVVPSWDRHGALVDESNQKPIEGGSFQSPSSPQLLIIEGPPGTGKTQTIASLVLNVLLHTPGARVLICAPSNCAVDEALLRIKRLQDALKKEDEKYMSPASLIQVRSAVNASVLRVGVRENTDPEVLELFPPVFLDDIVEGDLDGVAQHMIPTVRFSARKRCIASSAVVCSTLGSLNQVSRHADKFDVVIIDEASQGTEPDALQGLILASKKCILVGDSRQLQPTVLCKQASQHGLRRSLLVRLLRNQHRSFVLRTQYRMHPDIAAFPNHYIYNNTLRNAAVVTARQVCPPGIPESAKSIAQKLATLPRFGFINVRSVMEQGRNFSLVNRNEAHALLDHLRQLQKVFRLSWEEYGKQVGIITFYKAQRDCIYSLMDKEERVHIQIATVDSFQERKRILSL